MLSDDRDPVDVLAEEFADRLRRGEHPSVSAYAAAHPDHAEQLRELLPAVAQMELLKRFRTPGAEPSLPDRLGDFRIVRELGRGGMGVVFEAVQESLGRPVALKVLARHAQLDRTRRERFVREAQAAAKLHHTNIVPVFGVGEQDGLPYYVMQLIPGCGLHALVRLWRRQLGRSAEAARETLAHGPGTKPAAAPPYEAVEPEPDGPNYGDWRFVAGAGLQAAEALDYAHQHGVLHRDVKPANLLFDGASVWVADFGLAKLMNADGLTATGDILGTLQYVPPEGLSGRSDDRSDVYGLGATLYELLTLEPPYSADSPARLVKQVTDADPPPPRALNPDIPRDLETIVLKAMAREPSARYPSARELADDLDAFLNDRPIKARRLSLPARVWRVCRRNPAVASLTATTVAALALAAVTGWVWFAREEDRRKEAEEARAKADRATAEAVALSARLEANLKLSLDTMEKVFEVASASGQPGSWLPIPRGPIGGRGPEHRGPFGGFGPKDGPFGGPKDGSKDGQDGGPGGPHTELAADKAAILEAVLAFYDKFVEQNPPTPRLQFEAAKASRRVCEAHMWLRRPEKAAAAFDRAVTLLEPLVRDNKDNEGMRTELVMAYLTAPPGVFPQDPERPLRRAAELAEGREWLSGSVRVRAGWTAEQGGNRTAAAANYDAAIVSFTDPEVVPPAHAHLELGFTRYRLASVLSAQGKLSLARKTLEESVESLAPLAGPPTERPGEGPRLRHERELLAATYGALAEVCARLNDTRASWNASDKATQYGEFGGFGGMRGKKDGKKDWQPLKKN
ncbi:Serine/threonine-protein kinase PknB [Gemmata obscuriglobus]|uniref:Serine/threonine protein kinase n=1 Tax=Gemmata obscuriglobus TaxID=114 RepID=A0A2Z3HHS2_9BACT|nr:serine/threonine-protein kinase [Gemmata obscuriglobus]AWM40990.1 serine/threonine protein kinase [Gemmata obscuriglobus]QEG25691.1 Serine/threonine-protein kinase PknB [Gemmata obscuriglobus]VTR99347.1 serine threonine protein kinase : Protein kinase family protein OS=Singulisphaera acidiphila (strain ATCC BAA-1392 / DSM 18658 / VKM B-2454 / MOB10) GN=Sinac_2100 PE=3 SV=1: Pkinase_Tyr [Gemmata obscuriglobus UQM 2246]